MNIGPISPPSINGTISRQLCYAIWLSEIFISCVKTDPLWSLTQRQCSASLPHINTLSWLHLGASCFTATWSFEWGCLMLLEGEEHSSVNNCKRLDLNCCLMMTGGLFSFFFPPPEAPPHSPHRAGQALLQIARVVLLGPLKLPSVYLSLLFGTVEGGWVFPLLSSPASNTTPIS